MENKLVYQVLGSDTVVPPLNTEPHINVVNFKVENGMLVPVVAQVVVTSNTKRVDYAHESREDEVSPPSYNVEGLRRSKRRHVQPERYLGCNNASEFNIGTVRTRPYKLGTWEDEDDELSLPLSSLFGLKQNCPEQDVDGSQKVNKANTCREIIVYNRRAKTKEVKPRDSDQNEHRNRLAIIPHPTQGDPVALEHYKLNDKITRSSGHESAEISSKYCHLTSSSKLKRNSTNLLTFEPYNLLAKSCDAEKSDDFSSRCHYNYGTSKLPRKSLCDLDDMELGPKWEGVHSNKGAQDKRYRATFSRIRNPGEERTYRDRTLNAAAYKELINSYLKNINAKPTKEEPPISDQWKQFQETRSVGQTRETEVSHSEDEEETSELDILWREMEVSLASSYLIEDTEV